MTWEIVAEIIRAFFLAVEKFLDRFAQDAEMRLERWKLECAK